MNFLQNINPKRITPEDFLVVIEIPIGDKKKYEIDKETGLLKLDRILNTSFVYPSNYGFIPLTLCDDKDPLDVFVLSREKFDPMVLVQCRPIGVIEMIDNGELDEKIIAIPVKDPFMSECQDIHNISNSFLIEMKHFLIHYKDLENKTVFIKSLEGKNKALSVIQKSLNKYRDK